MQEDDAVKRIALLLLVAACGGKYQAPPPVASIALPDGSQLNPYDSTKPGKARPQGMAAAAGRVYVTLSNQRDTDTFPVNAGPGFLAAFNPSSDKVTLIDLGGTDGHQCQNPGFVRASADGYLYSPCSGNFSGTDGARAIVEVDPLANVVTRRQGIHLDRKSTRLNSSHSQISYAVFCLKKKNTAGSSATSKRTSCRWRTRMGPPPSRCISRAPCSPRRSAA